MILPVVALMVGLACFFTAVAYWRRGILDYLIAGIIWFALAAGSIVIQVPYQVYSSADNAVVTGVQSFASAEAMLAWVFFLLGIVMIFQFFYLIFGVGRGRAA